MTFSVASGGPQLANSYPGGHQVSTVHDHDVYAVQDVYTATQVHSIIGHDPDNNFQQPVCFKFNSVPCSAGSTLGLAISRWSPRTPTVDLAGHLIWRFFTLATDFRIIKSPN